jgi:two-component system, NarL family, invasion response regulator UvrY
MTMIRVFIADAHPIVRMGLRHLVEVTPDMEMIGEAANGDDVLEQAHTMTWDVLVLDSCLPGHSVLDVIQTLRVLNPELPILVLSENPEDQYAVRLLKCGIAGYLNKEITLTHLVEAIRKVAAGGIYMSAALAEEMAFDLSKLHGKTTQEVLSDREYCVLCLLGEGKTLMQIAKALFVSPKTVSTYRVRILEKLNLRTTGELVRYAVENHLC